MSRHDKPVPRTESDSGFASTRTFAACRLTRSSIQRFIPDNCSFQTSPAIISFSTSFAEQLGEKASVVMAVIDRFPPTNQSLLAAGLGPLASELSIRRGPCRLPTKLEDTALTYDFFPILRLPGLDTNEGGVVDCGEYSCGAWLRCRFRCLLRRRMIAFDLDGTLAVTKSPISGSMAGL